VVVTHADASNAGWGQWRQVDSWCGAVQYVFVQQCLQPLEALVGTLPFTGGTAGGAA
jgi:hypothetical protein